MARTISENSKHERLFIRVTKAQKELLVKLAADKNMSLSEYILKAAIVNNNELTVNNSTKTV
jgi:uncharacterized protein (DUF1778 family)